MNNNITVNNKKGQTYEMPSVQIFILAQEGVFCISGENEDIFISENTYGEDAFD